MEITSMLFDFVYSYAIKAGDTTILFDSGVCQEPEKLPDILKTYDIDPKKISLIIVSHGHWDHVQLLKALKDLSGAKVLCHKNAEEFLKSGKTSPLPFSNKATLEFIKFMTETPPKEVTPCPPDIVIGDEDFDLRPYGIPGKLIYTPGHADSAVALILEDRIAFVGDTVLDLHENQVLADSYPERTPSLNWINYDYDILKNSVRKVLQNADLIYSGHGGPFTKEELLPLVKC